MGKAKSKRKGIIFWLFFVDQDKINTIPTIGCNNRNVINLFKEMDNEVLGIEKVR